MKTRMNRTRLLIIRTIKMTSVKKYGISATTPNIGYISLTGLLGLVGAFSHDR